MNQQRGYQKTQTLPQQISKINDTSQRKEKKFPFIKLRDNKTLQQKQKKKPRLRPGKRKRSPSSSSSLSSSSCSPWSMADYVNLHFKNDIPDKDINENILTENPVPLNLQELLVTGWLCENTVGITNGYLNWSADLQVIGPLSRLWKGLEDVRNESSETVGVHVNTFATLIEQATLLLSQASLWISYTRIDKRCWKIPVKQRYYWRKKTALLQESESHLFGKKFRSHIIELNAQRSSLWKFLRVVMRKTLPFEKALYITKTDRKVEGDTITRQIKQSRPK